MARLPGFIGPSATVRSRNANAERTWNWYAERVPGTGKVPSYFVPAPCLGAFGLLGDGPVRALFAMDGRAFAVGGTGFYELFASGVAVFRGVVPLNAHPACISSNGSNGGQLLVTSGGENYLYNLTTNVLTFLGTDGPPTPTRMSCFSDGYFLALKANSNQFNISALYDGSSWDPLDFFQVSTVADQVVAMKESHRDIWLLGSQTSSVWANTGDADNPYSPIPGVKIDQGCAAAFTAVDIDNSLMWVGQSRHGDRVVWRAQGYSPQRVSTHAVEYALGKAGRIDDAVAFSYQQEGHTFYVLWVPALAEVREWGTTWVYDVSTDQWAERALWDEVLIDWQPDLPRCHAFGFGRHLVGDRTSGAIYELRLDLGEDELIESSAGVAPTPETPALASLDPDEAEQGSTVVVTLIGTGFIDGGTTPAVSGTGVSVSDVEVISATELTAQLTIGEGATLGARSVTVTTAGGTSNALTFTVTEAEEEAPAAPTLASLAPSTGAPDDTVSVTLTGTGFVIGDTTVNVSGSGVTVSGVVVSSSTSLTADFVIDGAATLSARTVTVTTDNGTSNTRTFTVQEPGTQTVLQPGDLTFLGYYRYPNDWDMAFSGPYALRDVAGDKRWFVGLQADDEKKLVEFELPTAAPDPVIADAPTCTYITDHGFVYANAFANAEVLCSADVNAVNFGGLAWDETREGFWFAYGDPYGVSNNHHPTLMFAKFSGGTLTGVYGPWRQAPRPNSSRGGLTAIPAAFGDAYLDGARFGIASGSNSGIATCPAGCNLAGIEDFDPTTLPAATTPNPAYSEGVTNQIENPWVFLHDSDHPQARDSNYKICFWWRSGDPGSQHYNCTINNHIEPGTAVWGGRIFGLVNENDSIAGSVWIDTATKRGLLFFGQLVTTPTGYTPPGSDPDGLVHTGYGDPTHATTNGTTGAGYEDGKCCHGQDDPYWGATGPFAHYKVPHAWCYDPEDLVDSATGAADLWSRTPAWVHQFVDGSGNIVFPEVPSNQMRSGFFGGPVFDPDTHRLYAVIHDMDPTSPQSYNTPVIAVWEVAA